MNIPIIVPNDGSPAYTGVPDVFEFSQFIGTGNYPPNAGALEFLDGITDRAKRATASFAKRAPALNRHDLEVYRLIAAVEASLTWNQNDPTIGPPVDAVVIEAFKGVRWIRRKRQCPISSGEKN